MHNMRQTVAFLDLLVKRRLRFIRKLRALSETTEDSLESPTEEDIADDEETAEEQEKFIMQSSLARTESESETEYHHRLQSQTDEYTMLQSAMTSMLQIHEELLSSLRAATIPPPTKSTTPTKTTSRIGSAFLHFSSAVLRPYITYSVLTTPDSPHTLAILTSPTTIHDRAAFVRSITETFKGKNPFKHMSQYPSTLSMTERQWRHHILRPLYRLQQYGKLLGDVSRGAWAVGGGEKGVDRDDRLCILAGLKIGAVLEGIESSLGFHV